VGPQEVGAQEVEAAGAMWAGEDSVGSREAGGGEEEGVGDGDGDRGEDAGWSDGEEDLSHLSQSAAADARRVLLRLILRRIRRGLRSVSPACRRGVGLGPSGEVGEAVGCRRPDHTPAYHTGGTVKGGGEDGGESKVRGDTSSGKGAQSRSADADVTGGEERELGGAPHPGGGAAADERGEVARARGVFACHPIKLNHHLGVVVHVLLRDAQLALMLGDAPTR